MIQSTGATGARLDECLSRLAEPALDIDETDNPLKDLQSVDLRRSVLSLAGLDHASEIALVNEIVARPGPEAAR
jgi:hypothetical protein